MQNKKDRMLQIFFRAFHGEELSVKNLADEFNVSTKSITRDINEIKNFLCENRDEFGEVDLVYSYSAKSYSMVLDEFLSSKELIALLKIIIGARGFSKNELLSIINKLKRFTSVDNKTMVNELIANEVFNYNEVRHDCNSVIDNLWQLTNTIHNQKEITIKYYKINRDYVQRRICPLSIMFTEYYYYLIAYKSDDENKQPVFFRVDRITEITQHRKTFDLNYKDKFEEGKLREKCQFMFPGKLQKIKFEFSGLSIQAILDKIPTAKIVERTQDNKYIVEAEVYGSGIKMFLLSQGSWVKVLAPQSFVDEMKEEIIKLNNLYD